MQPLAGVTPAQLLAAGQQPLIRLEIEVAAGVWLDISNLGGINYLKDVSVTSAGAKVTPAPIAGEFSATTKKDKRVGLILLDPKIGDYTTTVHANFIIEKGEEVEFNCPICNADRSAKDVNKNMVRVLMIDEKKDRYEVLFSGIVPAVHPVHLGDCPVTLVYEH